MMARFIKSQNLVIIKIKTFLTTHRVWIILALILIAAGYFRFYGLPSQGGIVLGDEQAFFAAARSLRGGILFLKEFLINGQNFTDIRAEALKFFSGSFRDGTFARPGFIFLIFLPILFFGTYDLIPVLVSGLLSMASIWVIYRLVKEITGRPKDGLVAALLLALSGYSVFFARTGLAQTTSSFFLILGILFYFFSRRPDEPKKKRYLIISGLLLGYLATTHHNSFIFIIIIFCFEIVFSYKEKLLKERFLKFSLYFLSWPLFWQVITYLKAILFKHWGFRADYSSYFIEVITQFRIVPDFAAGYLQFKAPWQYLTFMKVYDNILIVFLFLLFVPLFFYKKWWRYFHYQFLFSVVFFPFVFYSLVNLKTDYNFVIFLPLIAVICSITFLNLVNFIPNKYGRVAIIFILLVLLTALGLSKSWLFSSFKSRYREAARFLQAQGRVSSMCGTLNGVENTKFYLNDFSIVSNLSLAECQKAQFVLISWELAYFPVFKPYWTDYIKTHQPVVVYEQPYFSYMCEKLKLEPSTEECRFGTSLKIYKNY